MERSLRENRAARGAAPHRALSEGCEAAGGTQPAPPRPHAPLALQVGEPAQVVGDHVMAVAAGARDDDDAAAVRQAGDVLRRAAPAHLQGVLR